MRAIRFHQTGGPEVLKLEDVEAPTIKQGAVLVAVKAIGVNFADVHFRKGDYFVKPVFPQIAGMEAAGEVVAVGEGVTRARVGDRVMALGANAYAETMLARAEHVYPMPAGLSFEDAAALPVQGLTAMHCLGLMGRLEAGQKVLVHAAAGGVGSLAVQLARRMGASLVVGTVGSAEKVGPVRDLGAEVVVDTSKDDFVQAVKSAARGGVDVVLEMIGGTETYKRNLACMAPLGRMVVYGAASGQLRGTLEPVGLMGKNLTVAGYYLTAMLERTELCDPALAQLAGHVVGGSVRVVRARTFALSEAAEAHRAMESRGSVGKLVLVP